MILASRFMMIALLFSSIQVVGQVSDSMVLRHIREIKEQLAVLSDSLRLIKKLQSDLDRSQSSLLSVVPVGSIIPYNGALDKLPPSWKLCDGEIVKDADSPFYNKKVPNLQGYFIRGATDKEPLGFRGGIDSVSVHTHTIPKHSHEFTHSHDFYTDSDWPDLVTGTSEEYLNSKGYETKRDPWDWELFVPFGNSAVLNINEPGSKWYVPSDNISGKRLTHSHQGTISASRINMSKFSGEYKSSFSGSNDNRPRFMAFHYIIKIK